MSKYYLTLNIFFLSISRNCGYCSKGCDLAKFSMDSIFGLERKQEKPYGLQDWGNTPIRGFLSAEYFKYVNI